MMTAIRCKGGGRVWICQVIGAFLILACMIGDVAQAAKTENLSTSIRMTAEDYALIGLYPGDSLKTLIAKLGEPTAKSWVQDGMSYDYGYLEAIVNQGTIINLITDSSKISTRRGIHTGATLTEIKAVYGENMLRMDIPGMQIYELIYSQASNPYILRFAVKADTERVAYIGCRFIDPVKSISPIGKVRVDVTSATSSIAASKALARFGAEQTEYLKIFSPKYYSENIQGNFLKKLHGRAVDNYNGFTDPQIRTLLQETREHAYKVGTGEGMYFPILDYDQFKPFQLYVTDDMKEYIDIMALEVNDKAWEDGGLIISYEKALGRALVLERFLKKYDVDSVANVKEVKRLFEGYVSGLVFGSRHVGHFDFRTKIVVDNSRRFFDYVSVQEVDSSRLIKELQALGNVIRSNNFQKTEEVIKYQRLTYNDILSHMAK